MQIPDLGIETWWLDILTDFSQDNQSYSMPDLNQHVRLLADESLRNGAILGGTYNEKSPPPVDSADKIHLKTKDGSVFEYDRQSRQMVVNLSTGASCTISNGGGASIQLQSNGAIVIACTRLTVQASSVTNNVGSFTLGGKEAATLDAVDSAGELLVSRGW